MAPLTGRKLIYTINFVAGLAIFFFGYDQGMMGGVNTAPNYVELMDLGYATYEGKNEGWVATITNTPKQGGIVSVYYLGTLIGALIAGVMGDRIGRIKTMFHGSLWVCFGAALQCSSQNLAWILCARIINGIGTGYLNAVVPVWSAEVSSHKSRGAFIAMEFTLNIFGVVVAYWLSYGLGYIDEGASQFRWRFPMAFQLVPITIFMFSLHWMPESPRWLLKVGKEEEAKEVLQRLRADDENPAQAESELRDIADVVGLELKHRKMNNYWNMFWGIGDGDLHVARRVQLAIWLQIIQEWTGIAAITAPVIFTQAGYSSRKSEWVSGLNDITYMFSTVLATYTIDRWGRRIGLWWGAVGQGISMFLAGGFSRLLKDHPDQASQYGGAATLFVFLYTAIFGATWLDIPWVYPTEIYPLQVRAKGNALGVVGWSIGNGWLMMLNPVMFSKIAENTFYIFAAVNFASIPIVWAFYPETANRTLEELDILFSAKSPFTWDAEKRFKEARASPSVSTSI
ncbi:general substrate transporter [Fistulina hepatica ATCC 64428]|uniref:General substrate transporter n=1 Tax=Fistulina hepatica ATCC 64428 TaxID=1128425 RepID=A0A0D7ALS4_9AGAR|nr:general substrate transporter [Fistulina hepatica ATCC 64428]